MTANKFRNEVPQIALIGVTGFGNAHLESLQKLEGEGLLKLAAATIINRDEAAEAWDALDASGCRIYEDYEAMLGAEKGKIDICSIPTGIGWHCPMTVNALAAGCHVLVEKPVAATLSEVDEMIAARDATGLEVHVGFHDLYQPPIIRMKEHILAGKIGRVKRVKVWASWPRTLDYYQRNNWAGRVKVGDNFIYDSPANNALAHFVIAGLYFAGSEQFGVARIREGLAELYRAKPIETFDTVVTQLRMENGVEMQVNLTHSGAETTTPMVEVIGEDGSVIWEFHEEVSLRPDGESLPTPAGRENTVEMFRQLVNAMREGRPMGCSLEMAREHTRLINALHNSCEIHSIEPPHRYEMDWRGELLSAAEGINEALVESIDQGKFFAEMNVAWAKPATPLTLAE
ncbi:Gfo/Idh/MocA family protein [Cerasicoccus fimbriatus]|uniref:Gfo/Idh/MocA family protein n=1 Tax=Cerasicoccus fimbriatus TaxID=3014554 RepID=UPI0022B3E5B1|nr:Gfo/Idh/MocA family oxidoreductase [Cerasicoccus sp. TK19100]